MNQPGIGLDEFYEVLGDICNQTVSQDNLQLIEQALSTSETWRLRYGAYMALHAELRWRESAIAESAALTSPDVQPADWPAIPISAGTNYRAHSVRSWSYAAAAVLCGALVAYFGGLAIYVSLQDPARENAVASTEKEDASQPARIVSLSKARWRRGFPQSVPVAGTVLEANQVFELERGIAAIQFANGALVKLRAPARFVAKSSNVMTLDRGQLYAHVPRSAIGFTVKTETATVIDLGTEFAVRARNGDETEVKVLTGRVKVEPAKQAGSAAPPPVVLKSGESRRIARNSGSNEILVEHAAPTDMEIADFDSPAPKQQERVRLLHHWKFDETDGDRAQDSGERPFSLQLMNGAKFVTGKHGNAIAFDGLDDYAASANIPFASDIAHTVAYWARHEDPQPVEAVQVHLTWGKSGARYLLALNNVDGPAFNAGRLMLAVGPSPLSRFTAPAALPVRLEWQHWATVRADRKVTLFCNGQRVQTLSMPRVSGEIDRSGEFRIGRDRADIADGYLHGAIDDLAIWSGALTERQIQNAMKLGAEHHHDRPSASEATSPDKP